MSRRPAMTEPRNGTSRRNVATGRPDRDRLVNMQVTPVGTGRSDRTSGRPVATSLSPKPFSLSPSPYTLHPARKLFVRATGALA